MKRITAGLLSASLLVSILAGCNGRTDTFTVNPAVNAASTQPKKSMSLAERNQLLSNRIVVGYKGTLTQAKIDQIEKKYRVTFQKDIKQIKTAVFETSATTKTINTISVMKNDPTFTYAGNDQAPRFDDNFQYVTAKADGSGDPMRKDQWSLDKVDADSAWKTTKGKGVVISIVDTGVDLSHPDLKANLLPGHNAEDNGATPPQDAGSHGTHCAGIAAAVANNGIGVSGMAPEAKILPVRAIGRGGVAEVAAGIVWAADNGANVISLSLGWDYPSDAVVETLEKAVKYGQDKNVVFTCALSNSSSYNPKSVPDNFAGKAGFESVIGVGNLDINDRKMGASGEWKSVSAPGTNIISTVPGGRWASKTGTSMATPFVAGVAALVIAENPGIKNTEVRKRIMGSAADLGKPGFDNDFGAGRVNPVSAIKGLKLR